MNKSILKKLTFGFELEGFFDQSLKGIDGDWKEDGSVHIPNLFKDNAVRIESDECSECEGHGYHEIDCDCYLSDDRECEVLHREECNDCNGSGTYGGEDTGFASEYASPVFTKLDKMQVELAKFTDANYHWGAGCGLHLHIGIKDKRQEIKNKLFNATSNFNFINRLYNETPSWCKCLKNRLQNQDNHFYQQAPDKKRFIRDFDNQEKYRFVRFHPDHTTLEFRFLCPCEHKVENVTKLIGIVTEYLAEKLDYIAHAEIDTEATPKVENFDLKLKLATTKEIKEYESDKKYCLKNWLISHGYTSITTFKVQNMHINIKEFEAQILKEFEKDYQDQRKIKLSSEIYPIASMNWQREGETLTPIVARYTLQ